MTSFGRWIPAFAGMAKLLQRHPLFPAMPPEKLHQLHDQIRAV
jgi:hypothetical protein